jgi:phosphate transport system protein
MTVTVNSRLSDEAQASLDSLAADALDDAVLQIFALVRDSLSGATEAFLAGDRQVARSVVESDQLIDEIHRRAQAVATSELLTDADVGSRRHLLLILAILPELERSGDLAEHIAAYAVQGLAKWLTPSARKLVAQMGSLGCDMWSLAAQAYADRNGDLAEQLRWQDDEIDDLHVTLTSELAAASVSVPVAIEMALVARYFERLGDHAVNVTRQLQHAGLNPTEAGGGAQ